MKVCLLYRGAVTGFAYIDRTRTALESAGYEVTDIVWDLYNDPGTVSVLPRRFVYFRKGTGLRSAIGALGFAFFLRRVLLAVRPDVVHAVNEEMTFLSLVGTSSYRVLNCDLRDSLMDRVRSGNPLVRLGVWLVSRLCLAISKRIFVADHRRLQLLPPNVQGKTVILENVADDLDPALALTQVNGAIKIFVSGTLDRRRGLEAVLRAVEGQDDLELWVAGRLCDEYAATVFIKSPKVRYFGLLPPDEALRLASQTDAIFAYYAPDCRNHIYASPSKVFDAMSLGRPILLNSETKVSEWAVSHQLGYRAPYNDSDALRGIIQHLRELRPELLIEEAS
ncbi:hypothetical protein EBZ37_05970 [bacterium]|nr:hypothetical protein [bacterium]